MFWCSLVGADRPPKQAMPVARKEKYLGLCVLWSLFLSLQSVPRCKKMGACHYLTNRFQMKAPVAPSRSLREAFKRAPRSLRGACLREGFAEPPRRNHEPFAEVYEPFAEVAHTEGSTKTPWRVHEASSKGP